MKRVVLLSALVGSLLLSSIAMAASPTASAALTPAQQNEVSQTANELSGSGITRAAAVAVATSLVDVEVNEPSLDTAKLAKQSEAIYNAYTPQQKAVIDEAASKRNMTAAEVIGNYVSADPANPDSKTVSWSPNLLTSTLDGKANNLNVILSRPKTESSTAAKAEVAKAAAGLKVLNVVDINIEGSKTFKTLETALQVSDVKAGETIRAFQLINGKLVEIKVLKVVNGAIGIVAQGPGTIILARG